MIWMLRSWTIIYIHLNELISKINYIPIWLSDFQRNQFEILLIPSNFPNLILKNYNKLIAKNTASHGMQEIWVWLPAKALEGRGIRSRFSTLILW